MALLFLGTLFGTVVLQIPEAGIPKMGPLNKKGPLRPRAVTVWNTPTYIPCLGIALGCA